MLTIGTKAPDFTLKDKDGREVSLSDFVGKRVVLYFYPKDNTPGCTTEACTLRDAWTDLTEAGLKVLGVSADSVKSHQNFAGKYKLPFPLLSDPSKKMIESYGALVKKKMFGKEFLGIKRMSFLINPEGKIAKIYLKVKPAQHASEVLADLAKLRK